jgi:rubrerythrin
MTNPTIEEILREAIQGEIESNELYTNAVRMVRTAHVQDMLRQLAGEELKHRLALEKLLANPGSIRRGIRQIEQAPIQDYKIGDHLVIKPLGPESTFQDVCIFASRKEQQAHELYRDLAEQNEGETRDLLAAIAKDELRHKNLVEGWYEEVIYKDF